MRFKDSDEGLEAKIKINNCIFIATKSKNRSNQENNVGVSNYKWNYSCTQNPPYQKKGSLQTNFETRSRLHINLFVIRHPFSMYIIITMHAENLSYNRATHICENCPKGTGKTRNQIFCFYY